MRARWATALLIMSVLGTTLVAIGIASGGGGTTCTHPGDQAEEQTQAQCSEIRVTKTVTGEAGAGTTFDVVVDCEGDEAFGASEFEGLPEGRVAPFTETLTFGRNGGTKSIYVLGSAECTVSEDPPENCTLESIDPERLSVDGFQPGLHEVEVVNDCVAAALPLQAEPDFTG